MTNTKRNSLIISFRENDNQRDLEEAFKSIKKELKMRENNDSTWLRIPRTDIEELHLTAFHKAATSYKSEMSNFRTYLNSCINNLLKNEEKRMKRRPEEIYESTSSEDESEEELNLLENIADDTKLEEEALKKEQRQLIRHLYANTDEFAQKVIEKFLELGNVGATAKSLNSNADRVNRALARLGRQYDANRFGDPSDYFTA